MLAQFRVRFQSPRASFGRLDTPVFFGVTMNRLIGMSTSLKPRSVRGIVVMPPITSPSGSLGKERDPQTFLWMGKQSYDNNLKALDSVQFRRPAEVGGQYLDVGCGPGNFVAEALLPRLGHCRRLIATDKAASMVEYAREHYPNPAVVYDVLDIERGDVQSFVGKYGLFDRVYSFMAFHYVNDLERAYRNVFLALKDGGEFMTLSFTGTAITDVWYHLCCTEEWKAFLSNPKKVLYQRFCYSEPIPQTEIADNEGKAVAAAGLELVSCQVYDTYWTMPDIDSWLDTYIPFLRLDSRVPDDRRAAFRDACRSLLLKTSITTPRGCDLRHSVAVVHAQKPPRP